MKNENISNKNNGVNGMLLQHISREIQMKKRFFQCILKFQDFGLQSAIKITIMMIFEKFQLE